MKNTRNKIRNLKADVKPSDNEAPRVILPYEAKEEYYVESLGELPKKYFYSFVKRIFDVIVSVTGMAVLLLPMLIVMLLIKITTKGSIFYVQERLGKNGKKFKMIKFRTMIENAEANGVQWCMGTDDSRLTGIGRFLRKYHIDEIPQLWCIVIGEMSLVGPRAERECFYNEFETYVHGFSERLKVKPGLTGLAQLYNEYVMRPEEKIVHDIRYIKERSLWFDFKIMIRTLKVFCK